MAAGGQVCVGAGQRVAPGERVEHRPAWPGPDAGPDAAASEPRELGHLRRDERGAPVRGDGPGGGGAARAAAGRDGDRRDRRDRAGKSRRGHRRGQTPVHGVRGPGRQRDQHRPPVLCAGQDRARADRRPAVDPPRAHRRPGEVPAHGAAAGPGRSAPRDSWPSTSAPPRTPTASASISPAGTRSTATAPSCASSSRTTTRRTCCACRRTSPSPWPRARK